MCPLSRACQETEKFFGVLGLRETTTHTHTHTHSFSFLPFVSLQLYTINTSCLSFTDSTLSPLLESCATILNLPPDSPARKVSIVVESPLRRYLRLIRNWLTGIFRSVLWPLTHVRWPLFQGVLRASRILFTILFRATSLTAYALEMAAYLIRNSFELLETLIT